MNSETQLFQSLDDEWGRAQVPLGRASREGLSYYLELVRANWIPIALICLIALVLGVLSVFFSMRLYTADTRIEISRPADTVTQVEGIQADQYQQNLEYYETQYALLKAESLAERVVNRLALARDDAFFEMYGIDPGEEFSNIAYESKAAQNEAIFRRDLAADILLRYVAVNPVPDSSLVDVLYSSPSPRLSAEIANVWVEQFIDLELERRGANSVRARDFLELRLAELRERLEESEAQMVQYASAQGIVALGKEQNADGSTRSEQTIATASLASMNEALAEATAKRIAAEAIYRSGASGGVYGAESESISRLRGERALVQAEREQLLSKFEPGYPLVEELSSKIKSLDKAIRTEISVRDEAARSGYVAALQEERALREKVSSLTDEAVAERGDSIQYGIFQREVDTNRQLYEALLQRYKELGVADVARNNVAVVDRAEVPDFPSSPRIPLTLGLALLIGIVFAGGYVLFKVNYDQTLKDPAEVASLLGAPLLGAIPFVESGNLSEEILDRHSYIYEAYLAFRSNLEFLTSEGAPRSVQLTSTIPNEGKSNSALALARVLVDTGKSVLLIDADLRKPTIQRISESNGELGLSNYLSGSHSLAELVHLSDKFGFHILSAGPQPPNIGSLLMNKRMDNLVSDALDSFDHIVIDGPPVLGLADSPMLSTYVDGVVYVLEANKTKLNAIRNALGRLRQAKGNILGFVVTKIDDRSSAYGYGADDAYGYRYG